MVSPDIYIWSGVMFWSPNSKVLCPDRIRSVHVLTCTRRLPLLKRHFLLSFQQIITLISHKRTNSHLFSFVTPNLEGLFTNSPSINNPNSKAYHPTVEKKKPYPFFCISIWIWMFRPDPNLTFFIVRIRIRNHVHSSL